MIAPRWPKCWVSMAKSPAPRQRVGIPAEVQTRLKATAQTSGALLRDVFAAAVRQWLDRRREMLASGRSLVYLRLPRGLVDQLVDLEAALLSEVRSAAESDGVSVRAILFHALVEAAQDSSPP